MRYSLVVITGLLALLAITGAIGGFAYVNIGKTVSVFRELASHHESIRNRYSEVEDLINTADRRFIILTRVDQIRASDLKTTFGQLKDRIDDVRNTPSVTSSLAQDMESMQSALAQFLRSHVKRNTQPGAWYAANSQLQRLLAAARTTLIRLESQVESNPSLTSNIKASAAILNNFEFRCRQFADQQTVAVLEVVAPLDDAIKIIDEFEARSASASLILQFEELAPLRKPIVKFKAAAVLFDDEIQHSVAGASFTDIFERAEKHRLNALEIMKQLKGSIQKHLVDKLLEQATEGDRRRTLLACSAASRMAVTSS